MEKFQVKLGYEKKSLGWDFTITLPREISTKFEKSDRRLLCTINELVTWHCAMMPDGTGEYFIMISKEIRKKIGAEKGDLLTIMLEKDESKYGIFVPPVFEAVCEEDPEGSEYFHALTLGKQRSLLHIIGKPKSEAKQLEKNLIIFDYLKSTNGNLDFKELNEAFKNNRFKR